MFDKVKGLFADDTQILDDRTAELDLIGNERQMEEEDIFATQEGYDREYTIVRVYKPTTPNMGNVIIDALKNGYLCIVNCEKLRPEDIELLLAQLNGAIAISGGVRCKISRDIVMFGSEKYYFDDGNQND